MEDTPISEGASAGAILLSIFDCLLSYYGPQRWWPTRSDSRWEIMLGAVLTQRTSWTNVERALNNIESAPGGEALSDPEAVLRIPAPALAELLRPAGHHTSKPRRVSNLARFVVQAGGVAALARSQQPTEHLREQLLSIWGIGPETADAILLYALGRPVFVADAYAGRLAARWGLLPPSSSYREIQELFTRNLPADPYLFNEYHALIVAHGKALCRPRPRCVECPLNLAVYVSIGGYAHRWSCPKVGVPGVNLP